MNRSAEATIKGYYYQFDTSIKHLLDLTEDNDYITVEGIEDIDVITQHENFTVQCKYLSRPSFSNSIVREPISLMLNHFIKQSSFNTLKYVLYAHFEEETGGSEKTFTIAELKDILTYKENGFTKYFHKDKSISDSNLELFSNKFKIIFGLEFSNQQDLVIDKICQVFNCGKHLADAHYYNNALRVILDKAIKSDPSHRIITRAEFHNLVECKKKMFNDLYIKLRSKSSYLQLIRSSMTESKVLRPSTSKFIIIGSSILKANCPEMPIVSFIENLIEKYYKLGNMFRDAMPLTFVLDQSQESMNILKKNLLRKGIWYNDGYETISFNHVFFSHDPIVNLNKAGNKIVKTSFLLKLISFENFNSNITLMQKPDAIFHFSKNEYYHPNFENSQWHDIKYCENLNDVHRVLI